MTLPRNIAHFDLDTFFVSVVRKMDSRLCNIPVLVGGLGDRAVVASCSYEARKFGVHSAMSMKIARQLCPEAAVVRGDMDEFTKHSRLVTEVLQEYAPLVEKRSIDEHYIDLTGFDKYYGCKAWAHEMREKVISHTGLPISFGLSANKTVSKVATGQAKPNGELSIPHGQEKEFLAPLSIRKIPQLGERTAITLSRMGIDSVGRLQQIPEELMERTFGVNGIDLWRKANGIDDAPVVPYSERKTMGTEHTFQRDTTDMEFLRRTIIGMADDLAFELRKDGRLCSVLTVKIRYSNFDTHNKQIKLPFTASDTVIAGSALQLFEKLYSRRMLIRLVGVKLGGLVQGSQQISLFDDTESQLKLHQAMDSVKIRFGSGMLCKAINVQQPQRDVYGKVIRPSLQHPKGI